MKIKSQSIELNPNVPIHVAIHNIWLSICAVHFLPGVCRSACKYITQIHSTHTHKMESKQIEAIKSKAAQIAQTNTVLGLTYADIFFLLLLLLFFLSSPHHFIIYHLEKSPKSLKHFSSRFVDFKTIERI